MVLGFMKTMVVSHTRCKTNFEDKIKNGIKIHTIREDKHNRWDGGRKIHFSTGVRTGQYRCFKEGVCTGTQTVEIKYHGLMQNGNVWPVIKIDGKPLQRTYFLKLAKNDGFETVEEFLNWFKEDFKGKLIHWTDLRY